MSESRSASHLDCRPGSHVCYIDAYTITEPRTVAIGIAANKMFDGSGSWLDTVSESPYVVV